MGCGSSSSALPPSQNLAASENKPLSPMPIDLPTVSVTHDSRNIPLAFNIPSPWTPDINDAVWIKPQYSYCMKLLREKGADIVVEVYSSAMVTVSRSDWTNIIYADIADDSGVRVCCVVAHPDDIVTCPASVFNARRHKLCTQVVTTFGRHIKEAVNDEYEILQRSSSDALPATEVQLPPPEAFDHSTDGAVLSKARRIVIISLAPNTESSDSTMSTAFTADLRGASADRDSGPLHHTTTAEGKTGSGRPVSGRTSNALAVGRDPVCEVALLKYCGDIGAGAPGEVAFAIVPRTYLATNILPVLECESQLSGEKGSSLQQILATSACAAPIFTAYDKFAIPRDNLFITPEIGFVILGTQEGLGKVFINVLHHPQVGKLTNSAAKSKPALSLLVSCSSSAVESAQGNVTVLDVVISSAFLMETAGRVGGPQAHSEIATEVLQALHDLNFLLDADYALPNISGDYFPHSGDFTMSTAVSNTLNLTEHEKIEHSVLALCRLHKQGHSVRNWSDRVVLICETKLFIFDSNMHSKGDFPMEETVVEMAGTAPPERSARSCSQQRVFSGDYSGGKDRPTSTTVPFSAFRPPPNAVPFQLRNNSASVVPASKHHIAYFAAPSLDIMNVIYELLRVRSSYNFAVAMLLNVPAERSGWLEKEGHVVKNWKNRFFVVSYGVLEYYKKPSEDVGIVRKRLQQGPVASRLRSAMMSSEALGQVELAGGSVTKGRGAGSSAAYRLLFVGNDGYKLTLQTKSQADQEAWFEALQKHISYGTRHAK